MRWAAVLGKDSADSSNGEVVVQGATESFVPSFGGMGEAFKSNLLSVARGSGGRAVVA